MPFPPPRRPGCSPAPTPHRPSRTTRRRTCAAPISPRAACRDRQTSRSGRTRWRGDGRGLCRSNAGLLVLHDRVPADVEDGGGGLVEVLGDVEVGGDVEAGAGLEVELFDEEGGLIDASGDGGRQVCLLGRRPQPQHLRELAAVGFPVRVPVLDRLDLGEAPPARRQPSGGGSTARSSGPRAWRGGWKAAPRGGRVEQQDQGDGAKGRRDRMPWFTTAVRGAIPKQPERRDAEMKRKGQTQSGRGPRHSLRLLRVSASPAVAFAPAGKLRPPPITAHFPPAPCPQSGGPFR